MLVLSHLLADPISIRIGNNVFNIGLNFILYLIIAAIVGIIAERIVKSTLPFGVVGAIIAALIGIWLMTNVIQIGGLGDIYLLGVPLIRALIGAIILVLIWRALTYRRGGYRRAL